MNLKVIMVCVAVVCGGSPSWGSTKLLDGQADANPIASMDWKTGPTTERIGSVAEQKVGSGYVFLGASDMRKFMELNQNLYSDDQLGVIGPDDLSWFAVYSYADIGHVSDEEKGDLDADRLLETFRSNSKRSNDERRRRG